MLFLDADDWLAPDALARLAAALDAHQPAVAASGACAFVDTGRSVPAVRRHPAPAPGAQSVRQWRPCADPRRRGAGGRRLSPGARYGEDWEFLIRIALQGPFAAAPGRAPVLHRPPARIGALSAPRQRPGCVRRPAWRRSSAIRPWSPALARAASRLIRRTDAENAWTVGRELVRGGRLGEGRAWLARSVLAHPTAKRLALLLAVAALPLLPARLWGPWLPYPQETVPPG